MAARYHRTPLDGTGLIALDPWLEPHADALRQRFENYQATLRRICAAEGSLDAFTESRSDAHHAVRPAAVVRRPA